MNAKELKTLQAPIKERYRNDPASAVVKLEAEGRVEAGSLSCRVSGGRDPIVAGPHPATGGDGSEACSAEMLLQSLVACSGVTLQAVTTAMGLDVRSGTITAEADWDVRGTLGVDRNTPIGLTALRLSFELDTDEPDDKLEKLLQLTERYCVVLRTLQTPPATQATIRRRSATR